MSCCAITGAAAARSVNYADIEGRESSSSDEGEEEMLKHSLAAALAGVCSASSPVLLLCATMNCSVASAPGAGIDLQLQQLSTTQDCSRYEFPHHQIARVPPSGRTPIRSPLADCITARDRNGACVSLRTRFNANAGKDTWDDGSVFLDPLTVVPLVPRVGPWKRAQGFQRLPRAAAHKAARQCVF